MLKVVSKERCYLELSFHLFTLLVCDLD